MKSTITDLVNNPHLKTRVIAGADGLNNRVTWAHSCELEDPTPWITGGELIMTNGFAIPKQEKDQVKYLHLLANAGASGLAVSKGLHAPKLTKGLLDTANGKGFPILLTEYDVPWIFFSRTIATSNSNQEHAQVVQTLQIYDIVRRYINMSPTMLIDMLKKTINTNLYVIDPTNRKLLFDNEDLAFEEFLKNILPNEMPTSIQRIKKDSIIIVQLPIPSTRPALLLSICDAVNCPDNLTLSHVATIMGLTLEKTSILHERKRRLGAELITQMIEGKITEEAASILLSEHKLVGKSLCVIACSIKGQTIKESWLHLRLYNRGIPNLLANRESAFLVFIPMTTEAISALQTELPKDVQLGISDSLERFSRTPDAYQEALWALRSAEINNKNTVYYKEELPISPFLPRNRIEAKKIVDKILGKLFTYDNQRNTQLIKTLYIYLRENQSWKITSNILHIHKQTLVYRIKRIEEITGSNTNDISDSSELWLALQAAVMLDILPDFS